MDFGFDSRVAGAGQAHFELAGGADLEVSACWVAVGTE